MGRDGMGRDGTGRDKWDILPEMPYICIYTLMDHVDQLSQPSTNSHQLTPTGGVTYGMGRDKGHGTKQDIFTDLAYIPKNFLALPLSALPKRDFAQIRGA